MAKKNLLRSLAVVVVAGLLTMSAAQPARAQSAMFGGSGMPVMDMSNIFNSAITFIETQLMQLLTKLQLGAGHAGNAGATGLAANSINQGLDTTIAHSRNNLNIQATHNAIIKHQLPSNYSPCAITKAVNAQQNVTKQLGAADILIVSGNGATAVGGTAIQVAEMKAWQQQGVGPTPESPVYQLWQSNISMLNNSDSQLYSDSDLDSKSAHGSRSGIDLVSLTSGADLGSKAKSRSNSNPNLNLASTGGGSANAGKNASIDSVCALPTGVDMPSSASPSNLAQPVTGTDPWSLGMSFCQSLRMHFTASNGAGTDRFLYPFYAHEIAEGSGGYSTCVAELMKHSRPNSNFSQMQQANQTAASTLVQANVMDNVQGASTPSILEINEAVVGGGNTDGNWHTKGTVPMDASSKAGNVQQLAINATKFSAEAQDTCRRNIEQAIMGTQMAEQTLKTKEIGDLQQLQIQSLANQSKEQMSELTGQLKQLSNSILQLQAAIKSPTNKVPVKYEYQATEEH